MPTTFHTWSVFAYVIRDSYQPDELGGLSYQVSKSVPKDLNRTPQTHPVDPLEPYVVLMGALDTPKGLGSCNALPLISRPESKSLTLILNSKRLGLRM